jgi:GNAT superfamily N-acetyltransferase
MELKSLAEMELKDVLGPVNAAVGRGAPGTFPQVYTVAQLRERAALGVLDLKLSRVVVIGGNVAGAALVDRVGERAHLLALGTEPLASQRGGGRTLCEAVIAAAGAAGVTRLTALCAELDAPLLTTLQAAGLQPRREVARYTLPPAGPTQALVPRDASETGGEPAGDEETGRPLPIAEALTLLAPHLPAEPPFQQEPAVLQRLSPKLTAVGLHTAGGVMAAAIADRERRQLLLVGGPSERAAAQLCALLAARYSIHHIEALPTADPATAAVAAAGFARVGLRVELQKVF